MHDLLFGCWVGMQMTGTLYCLIANCVTIGWALLEGIITTVLLLPKCLLSIIRLCTRVSSLLYLYYEVV